MNPIRLHLKGYNFTPKWFPSLVTLVVLPLLIALGFWQLDRFAQKNSLQSNFIARSKAFPLRISQLDQPLKQLRYHRIQLTGHYDNLHTFLLDNKTYQRRVGYDVITPFILSNSPKVILVNRGWIPRGKSRAQKPSIPVVDGMQSLQGIIWLPPKKTFTLRKVQLLSKNWPVVIQTVNINQLSNVLNTSIYPFVVLLSPNNPHGFTRKWRAITTSPYKHLGYALQWFGLALTLLIIFIVVNIHRAPNKGKTNDY